MEAQGIGDPKMKEYTLKKSHSLFVMLGAFVTVFCFTVAFVPVGSAQQSKMHKWW